MCFVVVDVQKDFFKGGNLAVNQAESIIPNLNKALLLAKEKDIHIIYTRDLHPPNHSSFQEYGGPWRPHCVIGTKGIELHDDIIFVQGSSIVDVGTQANKDGYSAFENPVMGRIFTKNKIQEICVCGIALEYCVKETCLDALKVLKRVYAVEPLIKSISQDVNTIERHWQELTDKGVIRNNSLPFEKTQKP
ncbi:isochorismatase family protein [Acidobacteriota bacterium]